MQTERQATKNTVHHENNKIKLSQKVPIPTTHRTAKPIPTTRCSKRRPSQNKIHARKLSKEQQRRSGATKQKRVKSCIHIKLTQEGLANTTTQVISNKEKKDNTYNTAQFIAHIYTHKIKLCIWVCKHYKAVPILTGSVFLFLFCREEKCGRVELTHRRNQKRTFFIFLP